MKKNILTLGASLTAILGLSLVSCEEYTDQMVEEKTEAPLYMPAATEIQNNCYGFEFPRGYIGVIATTMYRQTLNGEFQDGRFIGGGLDFYFEEDSEGNLTGTCLERDTDYLKVTISGEPLDGFMNASIFLEYDLDEDGEYGDCTTEVTLYGPEDDLWNRSIHQTEPEKISEDYPGLLALPKDF